MGIQITRTAGPSFVDLYYFNGDTTVLQSDTLYTPVPLGLDLWRQGIVGGCGVGGGLYQMSGVQTITVEVVEVVPPNGMLLSPNPAPRMDQGDSLVFTASAKYTNTGENLWMLPPSGFPYAWSFLPDSSAATPNPIRQTIPGCWTDRTCKLKATTSGTLTAYGSFSPDGAATDSVSVHVDVTPCPWKDPIIDSWQVRQALARQFALSDSTQLERGGGIYRDSVSGDYIVDERVGAGFTPTQCRFAVQTVSSPGLTLVAIWHTHPIAGDDTFTNCPSYPPGSKAQKGPSRPWDYEAQSQLGVPEYIIDPTDVYRITPNTGGRHFWQSPQVLTSKPWKKCPNWAS